MLSKLCAPKITINFASSDRHQTQVDNNFDCTWAHLLLMVSALVTTSSNCCSGTRANKPAVTKWSSSSPSLLPRAPGCCNEVVKKFSFRQHSSSPSSLQLGEKVMPKARAYKWQKCKTLRNKKVTHPSCAILTLRKISPLWRPGLPFFTSPPRVAQGKLCTIPLKSRPNPKTAKNLLTEGKSSDKMLLRWDLGSMYPPNWILFYFLIVQICK